MFGNRAMLGDITVVQLYSIEYPHEKYVHTKLRVFDE